MSHVILSPQAKKLGWGRMHYEAIPPMDPTTGILILWYGGRNHHEHFRGKDGI